MHSANPRAESRPRLAVLSLAASDVRASQGSADLQAPQRKRRPRKTRRGRVVDQVGAWFPRRPQKNGRHAGVARFVMLDDPTALALMRCQLDHAATWGVLWAVLWRQQSTHPRDVDQPVEISVDELVSQTGYSRASVYRGLQELERRRMLTIITGGGRHHKSLFVPEPIDSWLLG